VEPWVADRVLRPHHAQRFTCAQRHADHVTGLKVETVRHTVRIGVVEGDRNQHLDNALGHANLTESHFNKGARTRCDYPRKNARSTMTTGDSSHAAADVLHELDRWLEHLSAERRMSAKTCDAYRRDAHQFLRFMCTHFGARVTLARLAKLAPQDVRAFMAARR